MVIRLSILTPSDRTAVSNIKVIDIQKFKSITSATSIAYLKKKSFINNCLNNLKAVLKLLG